MQRTNYCGLINENYLTKTVTVAGWVHKRRDLGGLIFIDLRDREGLLQCVVYPESTCFQNASTLKHEYVVSITGIIRKRPQENKDLNTGKIELVVQELTIINTSLPTPILVDDETTNEHNRMLHRIIDLRSKKMQNNLRIRHNITKTTRDFLNNNGFLDIETPFLTLSTPGGAKDFLVASSINKGHFYALPQSPQVFKQLLMVAGFDKYYQIVRCFRDEALRADRQPEFTQIDIETSFLDETEIRNIAENLIKTIFQNVLNISLPTFPIMSFKDAIYNYGVDKPDLRIPLKFIDLTHELKTSNFTVFNAISKIDNGRIIALKLPSTVTLSRKEIDNYVEFVKTYHAKGLAYIKVNDLKQPNFEGISSPILKFLSKDEINTILLKTQANDNESILICADAAKIANDAMGNLRKQIAYDKNLFTSMWELLWVVDFPLFEYDCDTKKYLACHHPFTAPKDEHIELLNTHPEKCLAKAYDLVLNGSEIGGGSVRIHDNKLQTKIFDIMGLTESEIQQKFGFLINNLQYGAPIHGGIAFGLDRIAAILCHVDSIRDVIAFPKTIRGQCLLTNAPSTIDAKELATLGITTIQE